MSKPLSYKLSFQKKKNQNIEKKKNVKKFG